MTFGLVQYSLPTKSIDFCCTFTLWQSPAHTKVSFAMYCILIVYPLQQVAFDDDIC